MINFAGMTQNALSRNNETQLRVLQARAMNNSRNNNTRTKPVKVVDGHVVRRTNEQRTDKKLLKVCKDFESIFVNQLFKVMRKTLNKKNNILHGGRGEEIFQDMLYDKYSKIVAQRSDFGFGSMLYDHLTTINRGY